MVVILDASWGDQLKNRRDQPRLCPRSQRARRSLATSEPLGGKERAMRAYLETIAMIAGLLGTYFALLPLIS